MGVIGTLRIVSFFDQLAQDCECGSSRSKEICHAGTYGQNSWPSWPGAKVLGVG